MTLISKCLYTVNTKKLKCLTYLNLFERRVLVVLLFASADQTKPLIVQSIVLCCLVFSENTFFRLKLFFSLSNKNIDTKHRSKKVQPHENQHTFSSLKGIFKRLSHWQKYVGISWYLLSCKDFWPIIQKYPASSSRQSQFISANFQ